MKIHRVANESSIPQLTNTKEKKFYVNGFTWEYKGYQKQNVCCCQKLQRVMMILLKLLGTALSLGLAAAHSGVRKSIARDVSELKSGKEKHKYLLQKHKGTEEEQIFIAKHTDTLRASVVHHLKEHEKYGTLKSAKLYFSIVDSKDKVALKEVPINLGQEFSIADLTDRFNKEWDDFNADAAKQISSIKAIRIFGGFLHPDGKGAAFYKDETFDAKGKNDWFHSSTGEGHPENLISDQLQGWQKLYKFPLVEAIKNGVFQHGYKFHF